jgi:PAS domain S-box-containing protein
MPEDAYSRWSPSVANEKLLREIEELKKKNAGLEKQVGHFKSIVRDITDMKTAEQRIQESEDKFRKLFQNHSAVKLVLDSGTGKILDANDAAIRFYGWNAEELKKMHITQINTLSEAEIKKEMEMARTLKKTYFNFKHRLANGETRDVEVFSNKITVGGKDLLFSVIHDITDKKLVEEQLRLISSSVEQSPVSIIITDAEAKIRYVNPSFTKITGYLPKEVEGIDLRSFKTGHRSQGDDIFKVLPESQWSGELRSRNKSGKLYWEYLVISPIRNDNDEVTNYVAVTEDITERKKLYEELVNAKEKAEESERMKLVFLANMSHEIRTPMNGILGFADLLNEPGLSRHKQQKFIEIIKKSGNRMLDTVNDLIDISRVDTGMIRCNDSEINLKEKLNDLYRFFLPQTNQKAIHLILKNDLTDNSSVIITDQTKLDSILTNLIKNAIKFTDSGTIEFGCKGKEGFLEFFVRDTGIGIPAGKQAAIFNRFEQAGTDESREFQGSGLGLAITKAYVELLNGHIWLESEEGKGSVFYFTIPFRQKEEAGKKPIKSDAEGIGIPRLKGKKVLISEDDFYSREMLSYLLGKTGAAIQTAKDGPETVTVFQQGGFDLVLLDIRLPGMDGFEVLGEIRSVDPSIMVIAQTAYAMDTDISRVRKAGFTDYLTKPVGQNQLYTLLQKYLR